MKQIITGKHSMKRILFFSFFLFGLLIASVFGYSTAREKSDIIKTEYFSDNTIFHMNQDSVKIRCSFNNINIFTSAHYGTCFLTGTADVGDIFDTRKRENMLALEKYARENFLILNLSDENYYSRFSSAALSFLREFGYDAILYHPDEFHPVFTQTDDTWMFIREEPMKKGNQNHYFSSRVKNRRLAVRGGLEMEPLNKNEYHSYYIPVFGTRYENYYVTRQAPAENFQNPGLLNPYQWEPPNKNIIRKRKEWGLIDSPLSNKTGLKVGAWFPEKEASLQLNMGFYFSGEEKKYTWSDAGIYLIPLEPGFWE